MGPQVDTVQGDADIPAHVDVVIIGGGIIGTSAALHLAQRKISVALCEKGHVAGEQSSRNWGWVRSVMRDPAEISLSQASLEIWKSLNGVVEAETGFRQAGIMFSASSAHDVERYEAWLKMAEAHNVDARMLSRKELKEILPDVDYPWDAALYCPTDGRAEPQKAAPAIARAAKRLGASILTDCAVRGLDVQNGQVRGVVTERGPIRCSTVIVAAGVWSRRLLKDLKLRLPQLKVLSSAMRTSPVNVPLEPALWHSQIAFRRRLDGGYTIGNGSTNIVPIVPDSFKFFADFLPAYKEGHKALKLRPSRLFLDEARDAGSVPYDRTSPYERVRVLSPKPDTRALRQALLDVIRHFPALSDVRPVQEWAGFIDVLPDSIPVISPVDSIAGLVLATGFSGHGFGMGPAAGRLAADLALNDTPIVDPRAFRYSRFSDGSRVRPTPGL